MIGGYESYPRPLLISSIQTTGRDIRCTGLAGAAEGGLGEDVDFTVGIEEGGGPPLPPPGGGGPPILA